MDNTASGIVAPCSTCKNQRYVSSPDGPINVCPRRVWQNDYITRMAAGDATNQAAASEMAQLALTGNDSDPSLTSTLNNPVYDTDGGAVLVWITLYNNNRAILDNVSGTVVNPNLNDGLAGFDTNYISCELLPYMPNTDEHGYFLNGALKEGDPVHVLKSMNLYTEDGVSTKKMAGTVQRSSIPGTIPRNPVLEDNAPAGT